MQIGDMNIVNSILDLEVNMLFIQKNLDFIFKNNCNLNKPNSSDRERFIEESKNEVKRKYPELGVGFK